MVVEVLARPEGGPRRWWGSWQGSPQHGHAVANALTHCASSWQGKAWPRWVLLVTPNCCARKVGITWVSPHHSR